MVSLSAGGLLSRGNSMPLSCETSLESRTWSQAGTNQGLRRAFRLGFIMFMAVLHLAVVASLASQYYSPRTVVNMQYREEEVTLVLPGTFPQQQQQQQQRLQQPRQQQGQQPPPGALLQQTIQELKRSGLADPRFVGMGDAQILAALDAALESSDFNPPEELGLDKNAFCKLVALKSNGRNGTAPDHIVFEEPVAKVEAEGVVLTTYFNSRVDPLRCYKHKGGRIEPDALGYIEHWYMSVVRLGLPAVVFHEGLSPEFVEKVQTDLVRFQRVELSHYWWSLCDERWAVYLDWLQNSGSSVRYVLQMDVSDTVIAANPFQLFASESGKYDLWVNVQKNTQWVQQNYQECYGSAHTYLLGQQGLVYNAGVVGGKRKAFEDLATAIVTQFGPMLGHGEKAIWNCDMAALHYVLTHPSFQAGHHIFNGGFPFCAGGIKCWKHGECRYYVYHK